MVQRLGEERIDSCKTFVGILQWQSLRSGQRALRAAGLHLLLELNSKLVAPGHMRNHALDQPSVRFPDARVFHLEPVATFSAFSASGRPFKAPKWGNSKASKRVGMGQNSTTRKPQGFLSILPFNLGQVPFWGYQFYFWSTTPI